MNHGGRGGHGVNPIGKQVVLVNPVSRGSKLPSSVYDPHLQRHSRVCCAAVQRARRSSRRQAMLRIAARLTALSLLASAAASAQRPDTVITLEAMTITAAREAQSVLATPLAITKVTAPDLRNVNGYGLEDALSRVPGVIAQSRYGTSDVRLIIRGFGARGAGDRSNSGTSRGVRVLLDGFPETEPDGRTAFDQIDLATAEAVEVLRSNASGLYGNAAGGVLNVLSAPERGL